MFHALINYVTRWGQLWPVVWPFLGMALSVRRSAVVHHFAIVWRYYEALINWVATDAALGKKYWPHA
jgi:hypothetical protein